jgi:hypothetical protein
VVSQDIITAIGLCAGMMAFLKSVYMLFSLIVERIDNKKKKKGNDERPLLVNLEEDDF